MSVMFLTDEMGNKKAVVLSIQEYEELEKNCLNGRDIIFIA